MEDVLLGHLVPLMASPWLYVIVFLVSAIDAFFPLVPSETVVITAGVFALTGAPNVVLVVVMAAVGAFIGDNMSYAIGRFAERRLGDRLWRSPRRRRALEWAQRMLRERGGQVIIAARFVSGGRTATTIAAGALEFDRRRFRVFTAVAAVAWGVYAVLIGYLGGMAGAGSPVRGVLIGMAIALGLTALVEVVRFVVRRVRVRAQADGVGQAYTSTTRRKPRSTRASSSTGSSSPHTTTSWASRRVPAMAVAASTSDPRRPATRSTRPVVPPGS
ncbi:MAG: DedA family protein [Streptosporangiales bacterium]|nr:DedA family protein [Streptosporangiales bacterium]